MLNLFFRLCSKIIPSKVYVSFLHGMNELTNKKYNNQLRMQFKYMGKNSTINLPYTLVKNPQYMVLGENVTINSGIRLEAYETEDYPYLDILPKIVIGDNVVINNNCQIAAINHIKIGNNTLIASRVFITDSFHGDNSYESLKYIPLDRKLVSKGAVIIGENVLIGAGVAIMPGVSLGNNCIIGVNTVVTKSFPDNCMIAGVPARLLKII